MFWVSDEYQLYINHRLATPFRTNKVLLLKLIILKAITLEKKIQSSLLASSSMSRY